MSNGRGVHAPVNRCFCCAPLCVAPQADRAAWEQEREQLLDQIHRFRISAEGLEVAVVRERKEKEVWDGTLTAP